MKKLIQKKNQKYLVIAIVLMAFAYFYLQAQKLVEKYKISARASSNAMLEFASLFPTMADYTEANLKLVTRGAMHNLWTMQNTFTNAQKEEMILKTPSSTIAKVESWSGDDLKNIGQYYDDIIVWYKKTSKNYIVKYIL